MATKKITKTTVSEQKIENLFSKKQLLTAKRFQDRKDILNSLLEKYPDDATFTIDTVEEMIENYMKGQVK